MPVFCITILHQISANQDRLWAIQARNDVIVLDLNFFDAVSLYNGSYMNVTTSEKLDQNVKVEESLNRSLRSSNKYTSLYHCFAICKHQQH